jgi:hypothetical protein
VSFDSDGLADVANGRIVIQNAGHYQINGVVAIYPTSGANVNVTALTFLYVNGAMRTQGTRTGQTDTYGAIGTMASDILYLNAGDYVELWGYSSGVWAAQIGQTGIYLSVALITAGPGPKGDKGDPGDITVSPAGGDLTGNYPNPTVAKVNGTVFKTGMKTVAAPAGGGVFSVSAADMGLSSILWAMCGVWATVDWNGWNMMGMQWNSGSLSINLGLTTAQNINIQWAAQGTP